MRRLQRFTVAVAVVLLAAPAVCARVGAAASASPAERQVLKLINVCRVQHGRAPLKPSPSLAKAARLHSTDMLLAGYFGHSSPRGATICTRARDCGYRAINGHAWSVGEVIGWGAGLSPRAMVRMWLKSPTHRTILLSPQWQHLGAGVVSGSFGGYPEAMLFTVDFGRRL